MIKEQSKADTMTDNLVLLLFNHMKDANEANTVAINGLSKSLVELIDLIDGDPQEILRLLKDMGKEEGNISKINTNLAVLVEEIRVFKKDIVDSNKRVVRWIWVGVGIVSFVLGWLSFILPLVGK